MTAHPFPTTMHPRFGEGEADKYCPACGRRGVIIDPPTMPPGYDDRMPTPGVVMACPTCEPEVIEAAAHRFDGEVGGDVEGV